MFPSLRKVQNIILDILFPPICLNCRKSFNHQNKLICENCLSLIKINYTLFCPICRARLAENKLTCQHKTLTYADLTQTSADKKQKTFSYYLAAAGNYDDQVLQNLIHYFKYKRFKNLAPVLGEILIKYLNQLSLIKAKEISSERGSEAERAWFPSEARESEAEAPAKPLAGRLSGSENLSLWLIVPVPLHPRRERERGFNQAKILAEIVAHHFNLTLIEALKRIKNTKPQAKIKDIEKRMQNIFNCFAIKSPEAIQGKNIILIDDVFTSGATINEAVKVLKQNGAKKVIALVLAKAR
jgi:predicted amidophosphoribosyltransferase